LHLLLVGKQWFQAFFVQLVEL